MRGIWIFLAAILLTFVTLGAVANTASATLLCSTPSCTEPYPAETALAAELEEGTTFKLLSSIGTVECEESAIAGETTAEAGEPLPLEISSLTFTGNCHLGGTACTVATIALPTSPSMEAIGEGNGTLSLEGGEVHVKCGIFINCTYLEIPALQFEGGNPASFGAEKLALTKEGICPKVSELDVAYTLTEPAPAYLVKSRTFLCSTPACTEPYSVKTALAAELEEGTRAKLLTSSGTVKCESSGIAGETTAEAGNPLPLQITELSFGKCELEGKEACTATTESLPTSPYVEAGGEGNGTLGLTGGEVNFKCGFFIRCTYAMPSLLFEGGNPASFGVAEVELGEFKGLVCPETSKLHVAYTLTKPAPAYLALM